MTEPLIKPIAENYDLNNFLATDSLTEQKVSTLKKKIAQPKKGFVDLIYGMSGTGKTHLLKALCNQAQEDKKSALYLSLPEYQTTTANTQDFITLAEQVDLICLDNLENLEKADKSNAIKLYQLINQTQKNHQSLIGFGINSNTI